MTPYNNIRLWKYFDRDRALRLLLDQTPLPTHRMPSDEELYASRELARIRDCESHDIDPAEARYGIHNPLFRPHARLSTSHFFPYPPLRPPRVHFYNPSCDEPLGQPLPSPAHSHLNLLMGRYLSGTLPRLTPGHFSGVLRGRRHTPSERFLVYQLLSLISFPNLIRLRFHEHLSILDIGRLAAAADVRRYDLSRHLECYCKIECTHYRLHPLYPQALRNRNSVNPLSATA